MKCAMFLRGVNVGGIKVPMKDLQSVLRNLGLGEPKTFLQTGNVTFESNKPIAELKKQIEEALTNNFNYTAFVQIYPADQLQQIIDDYPFDGDEVNHRYAIFCESQHVIDELIAYKKQLDSSVEQIAAGPSVVHWSVPKGSTLKSEFAKIIAKPKYKSSTTNRNINTLEKMVA